MTGKLPGQLGGGPKGVALQEILENWVAELEPGSPLPSERELAERFGVARMTVRAQIDRMVHRRLVYRQQGRGTFVAEPRLAHTEHLTSFTEDMRARGFRPGARLLDVGTVEASKSLAARMEVPAGIPLMRMRRVRTADGVPMAIEETHLPAQRFPGLAEQDMVSGSLYDLLEHRYSVVISEADQRVRVATLTAEQARLLETRRGVPAFRIERLTRDGTGNVIELALSLYRGDRYEVLMHARRDLSAPGQGPNLTWNAGSAAPSSGVPSPRARASDGAAAAGSSGRARSAPRS